MESSLSQNGQSSGKVGESRDWKKLPRDVMVTIMVKLTLTEVLKNVQFVCKPWYDTCKDPALWKKLHFLRITEQWIITNEVKYQKMAINAIDRSCGCLVEICFEYYGNDPLLLHMAQLSSKLRCLCFQCCALISNKALCEALEKLPLLKEIELTLYIVCDSTIRSIGQCCPNLVSFKLNKQATKKLMLFYTGDDSDAIAIAQTMSAIHHLQLIGNMMTNKGLPAILDSCSSLESLDIRACFQIDLSGNLGKRCADIMVKDGGVPHIWFDDDCDDWSECGDESEYDEY